MSKRRIIGIVIVAVLCGCIAIVGFILDKRSITHIYDKNGTEIAQMYVENNAYVYVCPDEYRTYLELVTGELEELVIKKESVSDAKKYLAGHGFEVTVYFDENANHVMKEQHEQMELADINTFASVLCDTNGHVLACYSLGNKNYTINRTCAASTIKPLSVYGPAIEAQVITPDSTYMDAPVLMVAGEAWPKNVEAYTNERKTVSEGLKKSMNTIAIRVLLDFGVEKSMDFISEKFGIDVSEERQVAQEKGEEEVLGNIGLGYLRKGVTVEEMAGYYQVFANGGMYQQPRTITKVTRRGNVYDEDVDDAIRVFSEQTAYTVNRMLKLVVEKGGTAEDAYVDGYDICGKTGTSEDGSDHWFVGLTPEYVCATWYGKTGEEIKQGVCTQYFANVIKNLPADKTVAYPE